MSIGRRGLLWVLASLSLTTAPVRAADECAGQTTVFDGLTPLSFGSVKVAPGARAQLHKQFPEQCSGGASGCAKGAYLVAGDQVTVGKTCGAWTYVQFIGPRQVSYGWVSTEEIERQRTLAPRKNAMVTASAPKEPVFRLTRGRGVPVCEAYLQRLNTTEFDHPAYCGRPENDQVPGFVSLSRDSVPQEELDPLLDLVYALVSPLDSLTPEQRDLMNNNGGVFTGTPPHVEISPTFHQSSSWTYDPAIDIGNDGHPEHVLIWDRDDADSPECGAGFQGRIPTPTRSPQLAFILTPDRKTIDQARTIQIFGHPDGGYVIPSGMRSAAHPAAFLRAYRTIGASYGIFRYRNLYYFDTFFDAAAVSNTLGVFLHREGKTAQVCELITIE